jgi:hypothetical protein
MHRLLESQQIVFQSASFAAGQVVPDAMSARGLNGVEGVAQVAPQVVHIFHADRETDE